MRPFYLIGFLFVFLIGCKNTENKNRKPIVFDLSDREIRMNFDFEKYDTVYTNLLSTVTNEAEGDSMFNLWVGYREKLENVIRENHFDWGTYDSTLIFWDRVYCTPKGEVEYYLFYVLDTAHQSIIPEERRAAYSDFIQEQLPGLNYPLTRDYKFYQCGTKKFQNL